MATDTLLLNIPPYEVFQTLALPFIFMFAVFFGMLSMINRFHHKVNVILAFAFALFVLGSPMATFIREVFIVYSGYTVLLLFFAAFVIGTAFLVFGRTRDVYYQNVSPSQRVKRLNKELAKQYKELDRHRGDHARETAIHQQIRRLKDELDIETSRLRH